MKGEKIILTPILTLKYKYRCNRLIYNGIYMILVHYPDEISNRQLILDFAKVVYLMKKLEFPLFKDIRQFIVMDMSMKEIQAMNVSPRYR